MAQKDAPAKPKTPRNVFLKNEALGIFWTVAFIIFLRVYILEPYVIPSESMVPTLLVGDHVFVARGAYDFKVPLTNLSLLTVSDPFRGDIVVFDYPIEDSPDAGKFFVKRVIGIPGDKIEVKRGVPYINGEIYKQTNVAPDEAKQKIKGFALDEENQLLRESIPGARDPAHWVQRIPHRFSNLDRMKPIFHDRFGRDCVIVGERGPDGTLINAELEGLFPMVNEVCPFEVPPNKYFVMGDNRDNSSDGRVFGFVDRSLIKGRVLFIWFSPPPGEVNPYTTGPAIFAALKDMIPGFFRMIKDPGRLSRVGDSIH